MQKAKRIVLGQGEGRDATGEMKKHVLESTREINYVVNNANDILNKTIDMELKALGVLTHDEHAKMVFEPGQYRSYNQVEHNPFTKGLSAVYD